MVWRWPRGIGSASRADSASCSYFFTCSRYWRTALCSCSGELRVSASDSPLADSWPVSFICSPVLSLAVGSPGSLPLRPSPHLLPPFLLLSALFLHSPSHSPLHSLRHWNCLRKRSESFL